MSWNSLYVFIEQKTFVWYWKCGINNVFLNAKPGENMEYNLKIRTVHWKQWFNILSEKWGCICYKKKKRVDALVCTQANLRSRQLLVKWLHKCQFSFCVLVLHDGLFEKQLSAPGHDRQLVLHVEAHKVADAEEHLILGPHLCGNRTHVTPLHIAFCLACTHTHRHPTRFTCPCASTSSRCRAVPPSIPLRTYWPEAELLSLTRKSPLQLSRDSACSRPSLGHRVYRHYGGWRIGLLSTEMAVIPPAMEPVLLNQTLEPWELLGTGLRFHRSWWHNRGRIWWFQRWFTHDSWFFFISMTVDTADYQWRHQNCFWTCGKM